MKYLAQLFCVLLGIYFGITLIACNKDENEDEPQSDMTSAHSEIAKSIDKNVSVDISYGDYSWTFVLSTSLDNALPDRTIKYGLECGYGGFDYQKYFSLSGLSPYTFVEPIFIDASGSGYEAEYRFWRTWFDLKDRSTALRGDERDLWNTVIKYMNMKEPEAKRTFQGRIFVEIDSERYYDRAFYGSDY